MTPDVRPLVAGNWKMNGVKRVARRNRRDARVAVSQGEAGVAEIAVCPPATLIAPRGDRRRAPIALGGQDCHAEPSGAFTGDISAEMLKDAGCTYVIVGHSERRAGHHETDAMVRAKAEAALRAGLTAIVCVGETRAERDAGRRAGRRVARRCAARCRNARRPRTSSSPTSRSGRSAPGLTPTADDVAEMHATIRVLLDEVLGEAGARVRILYGGSVKPANAKELLGLANVDGALVGGASLKAADFLGIAAAYR